MKNCFCDNRKKIQTAKATDNYKTVWVTRGTWNWGLMCETWNWSHPYENIPEAQGDRNGTAGGST